MPPFRKNFIKVGLLLVIQLFLFLETRATEKTFSYSPACLQAMDAIRHLHLGKARILLLAEQKKQPHNLAIDYLLDCAMYYELITSGSKKRYEETTKLHAANIERLSQSKAPQVVCAKAQSQLHFAIVKLMHNEFVSGAVDLRASYHQLEALQTRYGMGNHTKSLAFIKALLGTLPENYSWILSIVGLKGSFKEGFQLLQACTKQPRQTAEQLFEMQEVDYYWTLIHFYFGDKNQSWEYAKLHTTDYATNLMSCYLRAFIGTQTAHTDEAILALSKQPNSAELFPFYELDYIEGTAYLTKLDLDKAATVLKKVVTFSPNAKLKINAYKKLAWIDLMEGDTIRYAAHRRLAQSLGASKDDEDVLVEMELARKIYMNPTILKSRLLFDGGFYAQAENLIRTLQPNELKSNIHHAEYYYRYGRIMQEQRKYAKAIEYFTRSIELSNAKNYYYAPYSSMMLGHIYIQLGYIQTAQFYYQQALGYKNYKGKAYIHQKVKHATNEIN